MLTSFSLAECAARILCVCFLLQKKEFAHFLQTLMVIIQLLSSNRISCLFVKECPVSSLDKSDSMFHTSEVNMSRKIFGEKASIVSGF